MPQGGRAIGAVAASVRAAAGSSAPALTVLGVPPLPSGAAVGSSSPIISGAAAVAVFRAATASASPSLTADSAAAVRRAAVAASSPAITSTGAANSLSTFPLAVSANGRYLVTAQGTPFRLQTDAGWFCVNHASDADVTSYLNLLVANGFTSFILMNIVHAGGAGWPNLNEPNDFYNNAPFTTPDQLDTPNATYFARVSSCIDQALARGLAVQFFHTYMGSGGGADGWESVITSAHNTNTVCFNWGVYLANTFTQANIIWMHGGDRTMSGTALTRFQQIVAGIQSVSRNRLAGSEWDSPDTHVTDQTGFTYGTNPATSDMQIDSFYGAGPGGGGQTFTTADESWSASPTLPGVNEEPVYENAWYNGVNQRHQLRASMHWGVTSGAIAGGTVGAEYRWDYQVAHNPLGTFSTSLVTLDAVKAFAFYQSLSWWLMRPSGTASGYCGRTLIVSGGGSGDTKIASCMSSDGNQLLAYVPNRASNTSFNVDFRSMSGTCTAYWWNPTTGTLCNNAGSAGSIGTFANSLSSQSFTPPGDNGTGKNDWMLVCKVPS